MNSEPDDSSSRAADALTHLFHQLLKRDGHDGEYIQSSNKAAEICIDWNTVKRVNDAVLSQIEHYWYENDEGTITAMEKSLQNKCEAWRTKNSESCDCELLLSNQTVRLTVPESVRERLRRAKQASELVRSESFRKQFDAIVSLRESRALLSEALNSPYKIIEQIQAGLCARYGQLSAGCSISEEQCLARSRDIGKRLSFEPDDEAVKMSCGKLSTEHAVPGSHELIARNYIMARAAFALDRQSVEDSFAFGTVPTPLINVSIVPEKINGQYIILFNERFFSFAYEMAKVAALTLPITGSGQLLNYRSEMEHLERFLASNPNIERAFIDTVHTFIGAGDRAPLTPPEEYRSIILTYTLGIETFALAHEMAHSALEHVSGSSSLSFNEQQCQTETNGTWIEELEADYLALRVMSRIRDMVAACGGHVVDNQGGLISIGEKLAHCASSPFDLAYPLTPEFYFQVREIADDACVAMGRIKPPEPTRADSEVISFSEQCRDSPECDFLQDVRQHLSPESLAKQGHPSSRTRRSLATIWLREPDLEGYHNPISSIGNALTRNSREIWSRSRHKLNPEEASK